LADLVVALGLLRLCCFVLVLRRSFAFHLFKRRRLLSVYFSRGLKSTFGVSRAVVLAG
jgi:hypothetical protein